ncbi:MarR family transcriptional regulator [Micromonospora sp. WMMD998]|uniref:MarR family winged helix-turn-helix transcriptional regulator n=1 Tax=Micromonospora sp. WMMD998 TaxID=3016092 RepID=UPI00249C2B8D|nr:MarR family transcriptional regulator [Micromonospora sp. WMMD998]WFE42355.1 MarR family transcriptional regulator [Micromonospora sp. WMMD998]
MARPSSAGTPPPSLLRDHTGYLLHRAGLLMIRAVEQALVTHGLTGRKFFALTAVHSLAPLSQQELSNLFALDPTTVVAMVDEFETAGLVRRQRSETDRRRYDLIPTEAGLRLLATATEAVTDVEETFLAPLTDRQRTALHRSLTAVLHDDPHA